MTESLDGNERVSEKGYVFGNVHFDIDVIASDNHLSSNGAYLDFDVNDAEALRAYIDLHETRVDRLVELSEASDQTDGTWAFR